jgi:hypothetical protein
MAVKARFYVNQVAKNATGYSTVTMSPSTKGEENKDWAKYTPSGSIQLTINPETSAGQWFEDHLGDDISITFDEVQRVTQE